jgi:hypothetical protein
MVSSRKTQQQHIYMDCGQTRLWHLAENSGVVAAVAATAGCSISRGKMRKEHGSHQALLIRRHGKRRMRPPPMPSDKEGRREGGRKARLGPGESDVTVVQAGVCARRQRVWIGSSKPLAPSVHRSHDYSSGENKFVNAT